MLKKSHPHIRFEKFDQQGKIIQESNQEKIIHLQQIFIKPEVLES